MRSLAKREVLPSGAGSAMAGESGSSLLIHEDSHEWVVVSSEVRTGLGPYNLWPKAIFLQERKGAQASSQRSFPMNSQPPELLWAWLWRCSCGRVAIIVDLLGSKTEVRRSLTRLRRS